MNLPHPLRITFGKVIIDRNDVYPFSGKSIQICRKRRHKGLTFTGLHLGNTPLMQNNSANQLYPVMTHSQNT